jgi:hypothetical protein
MKQTILASALLSSIFIFSQPPVDEINEVFVKVQGDGRFYANNGMQSAVTVYYQLKEGAALKNITLKELYTGTPIDGLYGFGLSSSENEYEHEIIGTPTATKEKYDENKKIELGKRNLTPEPFFIRSNNPRTLNVCYEIETMSGYSENTCDNADHPLGNVSLQSIAPVVYSSQDFEIKDIRHVDQKGFDVVLQGVYNRKNPSLKYMEILPTDGSYPEDAEANSLLLDIKRSHLVKQVYYGSYYDENSASSHVTFVIPPKGNPSAKYFVSTIDQGGPSKEISLGNNPDNPVVLGVSVKSKRLEEYYGQGLWHYEDACLPLPSGNALCNDESGEFVVTPDQLNVESHVECRLRFIDMYGTDSTIRFITGVEDAHKGLHLDGEFTPEGKKEMVSNIKPSIKDSGFSITPNPASTEILLKTDKPILWVKIYDSTGRERHSVQGNINTLNISHLATGVYNVVVGFKDSSTQSKQLLKK